MLGLVVVCVSTDHGCSRRWAGRCIVVSVGVLGGSLDERWAVWRGASASGEFWKSWCEQRRTEAVRVGVGGGLGYLDGLLVSCLGNSRGYHKGLGMTPASYLCGIKHL